MSLPGSQEPRREPLGPPAAPIPPPPVNRDIPAWGVIIAILGALIGIAFLLTAMGVHIQPK